MTMMLTKMSILRSAAALLWVLAFSSTHAFAPSGFVRKTSLALSQAASICPEIPTKPQENGHDTCILALG